MLTTTLTVIEVGVSYKFEKDYTFTETDKSRETLEKELLAKYETNHPKRHFMIKKKI